MSDNKVARAITRSDATNNVHGEQNLWCSSRLNNIMEYATFTEECHLTAYNPRKGFVTTLQSAPSLVG